MPSNLEARVAGLRKARSDQADRSTSKSTPVRQPYSSWLEGDGERVEEWLAEQKIDPARRRASVQEQTAMAFWEALEKMATEIKAEEEKKQEEGPKVGIERRWTTGHVGCEGSVLTGVGAFASEETLLRANPHLSFTFSQPDDEPMLDAPPQNVAPGNSQTRPTRS